MQIPTHILNLTELKTGVTALIRNVSCLDAKFINRLRAFGLIQGTPIKIIRRGLFNSSMIVLVKGTQIALRTCDAKTMSVILENQSNNTDLDKTTAS
jgi:Fe2+ transport system protein FeoA